MNGDGGDGAGPLAGLSQTHRAALDEAVAWIRAELDPLGMVATGAIVRGEGHAASDPDLVVRWRGPGRPRIRCCFAGMPAELFASTDDWLRRSKVRLAVLARADADSARRLPSVLAAVDGPCRKNRLADPLREASAAIIGVDGFFERDSGTSSRLPLA